MKFKGEMNKIERITMYLCISIGIVYVLGWIKLIPSFARNTIIYILALPMVILLAINNKKRSMLSFIFFIIASVIVAVAVVISIYLLIVRGGNI